MMNENLQNALQWRYATKKFDATKKIDEEVLNHLLEMANLTATSFGLQGYKMVVVASNELKQKLKPATFNQVNIQTCSHLLVLCLRTDVDETYIEEFIQYAEKTQGLQAGTLDSYQKACNGFIGAMNQQDKVQWLAKQTYIVLGNLLTACALAKVDSCALEGFIPAQVDEVLGLEKENLKSVLLLPIGYRAGDDTFAEMKKVRKPLEEMIIKL